MAEKRRTKRFEVGKTSVIKIDGVSQVIQIGDVSYGGVGFITDARPQLGSQVTLEADQSEPVRGKVVRHTENGFAVELTLDRSAANYALKNIITRLNERKDPS